MCVCSKIWNGPIYSELPLPLSTACRLKVTPGGFGRESLSSLVNAKQCSDKLADEVGLVTVKSHCTAPYSSSSRTELAALPTLTNKHVAKSKYSNAHWQAQRTGTEHVCPSRTQFIHTLS